MLCEDIDHGTSEEAYRGCTESECSKWEVIMVNVAGNFNEAFEIDPTLCHGVDY